LYPREERKESRRNGEYPVSLSQKGKRALVSL